MVQRFIQKFAAWLGLAAALFMGVAPTHGLVLCFEPSGSLALEAAVDGGRCGGCPDSAPSKPAQPGERIALEHPGCLCADILVSGGVGEQRIRPRPLELHLANLIALAVVSVASPMEWRAEPRERVQAAEPRAAPVLRLIRSVVLLV